MTEGPTREEVDAKLATLDAKSDARFKELLGEMRTTQANFAGELRVSQTQLAGQITGAMGELRQELDGKYEALKAASAGKLTVILTGVSTAVAIAAVLVTVVVGMATSGQQMFGLGQSTHEIAAAAAHDVIAQQSATQTAVNASQLPASRQTTTKQDKRHD